MRRKVSTRRFGASIAASTAVLLGTAGVVLLPVTAGAVATALPGNPAPQGVSYEADCTTTLQAGTVAPFAVDLSGDVTSSSTPSGQSVAPGGTFGFSGTVSTVIVGPFLAATWTALNGVVASSSTSLSQILTVGPTDANSTINPAGWQTPATATAVTSSSHSVTFAAVPSNLAVGDPVAWVKGSTPETGKVATISGATITIGPSTPGGTVAAVAVGEVFTFTSPRLYLSAPAQNNGGGSAGVASGAPSAAISWSSGSTTLTGKFAETSGKPGASPVVVGDGLYLTYATGSGTVPAAATVTAVNGPANAPTSVTINAPTTGAGTATAVGWAKQLTFPIAFTTSTNAYTATSTNATTAGIGINSFIKFSAGAIPFGGAAGVGTSDCLETGYDAAGNPGPVQTGGTATAPVLPVGTTTALTSVSPIQLPAAAYINVTNGTSGVPFAPTGVTAAAGSSTTASLSWTAPSAANGATITGYTVTPYIGQVAQTPQTFSGTGTTGTVTGLTADTTYSFTVVATSSNGPSPASGASATYTTPAAATAPGAPTAVTATPGNGSASVSWTAPVSNGGSAITGYTVTSSPGGLTCSTVSTSCTVGGLTNGTSYTFTVVAINYVGAGSSSLPSNSVTPATVPGAPTNVGGTSNGNASSVVSWSAPTSTGGSAIIGYTVTATDATNPVRGGQSVSGSTSPITVTGLTNADRYSFTVVATNSVGSGSPSTPSVAAVPLAPGLNIVLSVLPTAVPGTPYGVSPVVTLQVLGAVANSSTSTTTLKWTKVSLPKGMILSTTGVLSGTPNHALYPGTFALIVKVTESIRSTSVKPKPKSIILTTQATISLSLS